MTQNNDNLSSQLSDLLPSRKARSGRRWVSASLLVLVILIALTSYLAFHTSRGAFGSGKTQAQAPLAVAPAVVSITDKGFSPATVYIKAGQAVTWTNTDSNEHSIVNSDSLPPANSPDPTSPQPLVQNDSYSYVFSQPGTYDYHDKSSSIKGTVIVK